MNNSSRWLVFSAQVALALLLVLSFFLSARVNAALASNEAQLYSNALREPQSADPLQTFIEITLPTPTLPMLSAGYLGVAPGIHLVRLNSSLPLANIDPLEHPSRRRFGRLDLAYTILQGLPLALLLFCLLVAWRVRQNGSLPQLLSGRRRLLDLLMEQVLLPLSAWLAFCFAALLSCLYAFGLRLETNEQFLRAGAWALGIALYAVFWLALFLFLLLRSRSISRATLRYSLCFLLITQIVPGLGNVLALAAAQPEQRIALSSERRQRTNFNTAVDQGKVLRMARQMGIPLAWSDYSLPAQRALTSLAIEQEMGSRIDSFLDRIRRYEFAHSALLWASPTTLTQALLDDLAGTGLRRFASFREQAALFNERWRAHMLPLLLKRQSLDFDGLRSAPRFAFEEEASSALLVRVSLALSYLCAACLYLLISIASMWRKTIKNAAP